VALDGARLATVRELARDGVMPNVAAILAGAAGGEVYGGSRRDPRGFWRAVLSGGSWRGEPDRSLWSRAADAGLRSVAIALPDTRELLSPTSLVLPGADEVTGFIGDNAGTVASMAAVKRGELAWPYVQGAQRAREAVAGLSPGKASDWISVGSAPPDDRTGMFRIYRLDADAVYLSPVYRAATPASKYVPGAPARLVYVPDDPAWTVDSSRLRDYFYVHARDLTGARADLATELAAGRWPLLVYFESLLGLVEQAYPARPAKLASADETVLRDAYHAIDSRIGRLVSAAGPRTAIVLLGREPAGQENADDLPQSARATTGFVFVGEVSSPSVAPVSEPAHVARVARNLIHLLALPGADHRATMETVAAKGSRPGVGTRSARRGEAGERGVPLTPDSLRDLGLLSDSTRTPDAETDDASAASSVTD